MGTIILVLAIAFDQASSRSRTRHQYRPGLLTPERRALSLEEIPSKDLPAALRADQPICSDCLLAESFRETYSDRVLDDPWHTVDRRSTQTPGPMA